MRNGDIHMGHALNKVFLKDFIVRYKSMDWVSVHHMSQVGITHGLPIEQALTNKGVNGKRNDSC